MAVTAALATGCRACHCFRVNLHMLDHICPAYYKALTVALNCYGVADDANSMITAGPAFDRALTLQQSANFSPELLW